MAFIFLLILLGIINKISAESITGEIVTGEASQTFGISIFVTAYFPSLVIYSPQNKTYLTNESILLNYSARNAQAVWYSLDNLTNNITITSFLTFNISQGSHIIYLYANSSFGNITSKNVSFFVNSTYLKIIDDKFDDGNYNDEETPNKKEKKKGDSTDFLGYSYEELQNLSSIIFDEPAYGKIEFREPINLTNDASPNDNIINFDDYVNISQNRIEINSTGLPNFNKKATLMLYNLSFSNPRILINGEICPSFICPKESYQGGALKNLRFNVTGFSVYSAEESSIQVIPSQSSSGGGGGGWGGGAETGKETKNFSLNGKKITISLKQGEIEKKEIGIQNTGNEKLDFVLEILDIGDFVKINKDSFELSAGEFKTIALDFFARDDALPDLYIGKLIVTGGDIKKEILIAIEVESKGALFDSEIKIPEKFLAVFPGENIVANIRLFEVENVGKVDVEIEYKIVNENGESIFIKKETLAVEGQINFIRIFKIPESAEKGEYTLYAKINYKGKSAGASILFIVKSKEKSKPNFVILLLAAIHIILVVMLIVIIYIILKLRKASNAGKWLFEWQNKKINIPLQLDK